MMRKKTTAKKKKPVDSGYSKGIFYAMAFLCLASFTTACVTLGGYFGKDDNDRVLDNLDTRVNVVELVPEQAEVVETDVEADAVITLINPAPPEERWLHLGVTEKIIEDQIERAIEDALTEHNDEKHTYSPHYTLLKCHQLGTNTFSCKIVQGENIPLPEEKDVPVIELTPKQEEKFFEEEPEVKEEKEEKSSWNPFN